MQRVIVEAVSPQVDGGRFPAKRTKGDTVVVEANVFTDGHELVYTYDTQGERTGITALLTDLGAAGIRFKDLSTSQSSLEEIFVNLVKKPA